MTTAVERILGSLQGLSEAEKHELVVEILRRTADSGDSPLSDDDLVLSAETLFLELDTREARND